MIVVYTEYMDVLVIPADPDQPSGREVVRKTANLPDERQRLLREAEVLRAANERGVPGLAAVVIPPSPDVTEPCLVTSAVAGPSLAVAAPLPILEVAGVAAEVARLLAGLHEAGLVHGAVEPSHVVLDGDGGVILVGLGAGGPTGGPSLDPATAVLDPAADVAGWGVLVTGLLDWSAANDEEPLVALRRTIATRRSRRARRRPSQSRPGHDERRVLAALADQAQDPDPGRRPSARSLAVAVTHRIPQARVPGAVAVGHANAGPAGGLLDRLAAHVTHGPSTPATDSPPESSGGPLTGGAVENGPASPTRRRALVTRKNAPRTRDQVVPVLAATRPQSGSRPDAAPRDRSVDRPEEVAPPDRPRARERRRAVIGRRRWAVVAALGAVAAIGVPGSQARWRTTGRTGPLPASRPVCPPVSPPAADIDGDGCEEAVRWSDGVLQAGSARFALGGSGDAWAVGDWDCDGRRTPALLHQGTLAVFDTWPGPAAELQGRQVATTTGSAGLSVVPGPDGCEQPALSRPGTADLPVDVRKP